MSTAFELTGAGVRMHLHSVEVDVLRQLVDAFAATLDSGDPDDPVLERLFPTAVHGDEDADRELRRLLRGDLVDRRRDGMAALGEILDRAHRGSRRSLVVDLEDDEPHLVLGVLNDLRLAIGARVGIEDLDRSALVADDEMAYRVRVMDHLGMLQEELLEVLDPESTTHRSDRSILDGVDLDGPDAAGDT